MKIFNIKDCFQNDWEEYIIGSREIGKHSVYFVYGEVPRNERRKMGAPKGHDEIIYLLSGEVLIEKDGVETKFSKEQAVYMANDTFTFIALKDCNYIVAGAHTMQHDHQQQAEGRNPISAKLIFYANGGNCKTFFYARMFLPGIHNFRQP